MCGNPHHATDVVAYTYTVYVEFNLYNIPLKSYFKVLQQCHFQIMCLKRHFKAILYKVYSIKHKEPKGENCLIECLYFLINLSLFSYESICFLFWLLYLFSLLTLIRCTEELSNILLLNGSSYRKWVSCVYSRCVLIGCREGMRSFFFRWWYYFPELGLHSEKLNIKNMSWWCGWVL